VATEARSSLLSRMLTAEQVAEQLGNLVSPHQLRKMAREGRIAGAVRILSRVYFDRRTPGWLLQSLDGRPFIDEHGKPHRPD